MQNASNVLQNARQEPDEQTILSTESFYIDNVGKLETASSSQYDEYVLEHLATNFVSPVQSVEHEDGSIYYGVIEYVEGDEWYGFYAYDSRSVGRRVVGARNAQDATNDAELPHVSAGDPSGSFADKTEVTYDELGDALAEYYDKTLGPDRGSLDTIQRGSVAVPSTRRRNSGPKTPESRGRGRAEDVAKGQGPPKWSEGRGPGNGNSDPGNGNSGPGNGNSGSGNGPS